jgi:hypothetical protein
MGLPLAVEGGGVTGGGVTGGGVTGGGVTGGGDVVAAAFTMILKAGRAADAVPSLAEITIPLLVPAVAGVPDSCPVLMLKLAHEGLFCTLNDSV